jgi:hypothetical protein
VITRPFFLSESVPDSTCTDACRRQGGTTCRVSLALRLHTMMDIGCKCWEGCFGFFSPPCRRRLEADKTGLSFFEPFVHGRACPSQVTCDFARRPITRIVGHVCHPGSFGRTSSFLGSVFAGGFAVVGSHQRNLSSVESTWDEVPVRGATMYGILFFCKSPITCLHPLQRQNKVAGAPAAVAQALSATPRALEAARGADCARAGLRRPQATLS